MNIVHVTRSLITNSGISVFVCRAADAMVGFCHDVHVRYTWYPEMPVSSKVDVKPFKALDEMGFVPDIVHIHGLWSLDMVKAMFWCRRNGIKYIVSPHGGLMPRVMQKAWLKKRVFYYLFLKRNLNRAAAIHCTGDGEVLAVKNLGIQSRTFIVPLGCDIPQLDRSIAKKKQFLFLSRIGEEKGLVCLLDAWKSIVHNGWKLLLAGPDWEGYQGVIEKKISDEKITDVNLYGQADSTQRDNLYRSSSFFILPSPMENFSMVVLDALAYGVPVICTKGCPWQAIETNKCGWWVTPNNATELATAIKEAMVLQPEELQAMGIRAVDLARGYCWGTVAKDLIAEYEK